MKKTLLLMRHAKSSWSDPGLEDFHRPLNKRGKRDAPVMGERLKRQGYMCDRLIASPAQRALKTAEAVAEVMRRPDAVVTDERLYMAGIADFLEVIGEVPESVRHLMIVSHNPGTEALFSHLSGETVARFPTAAYALMEIDEPWNHLTRGVLVRFDYPKSQQ